MSDGERSEHDSMGEIVVPAGAKWQAQTQRAVGNFPVSGQPVPKPVIVWLAQIKAAAAHVNAELGVGGIDAAMAGAIAAAAAEVIEGAWFDQFPIDVFQTGSGTSTNMNMNEVLATLAAERLASAGDDRGVHPNDHVNASQSSNDVVPSAIRLAVAEQLTTALLPALRTLARVLRERSEAERDTVKAGRTHLMDAMPVTFGQELGGYARMIELGIERVSVTFDRLRELPLGGTAVGTGTNCPVGFAPAVIDRLSAALGLPLDEATDHFEAQGAQDVLVEVSGACRVVAVSLNKIANDLRWMALRAEHRARRDPPPGVAAWLVDHARQGESGHPRGRVPGRRAGDRERRRGGLGRGERPLRAQRDAPGAGEEPARDDVVARRRRRRCWPSDASPASPPIASECSTTPAVHRRS